MDIIEICEINRRQVFTWEQAQEVLPIILRITKVYSQKVDALIDRIEALGNSDDDMVVTLESEVNLLIQEWQTKVQKLGALPKGLWIADFDAGDGYFCWKYPERGIDFWHHYSDGYSKRMRVSERCTTVSLQDRLRRRVLSFTGITTLPRPESSQSP